MAGILTDMESAETFKAYESYLLGQPAKAGTVLRQGAFFYIWKEKFETDGTVLQTSYGTVVTTLDSESKTLFACREFLGARRLPSGVTAALSEKGIYIFPDGLWTPGEDFAEWKREIDFTMYTVTAEEAGTLYGISGKTVASDCEKGAFKKSEARKSGKAMCVRRPPARAIGRRGWRTVTGGNPVGAGLSQEMPWNVFMARRSLKKCGKRSVP